MRKIEIKSWKVKTPDEKEIDESLLSALSVLVTNKKPEDMPRGFESFKLFGKLVKAFEKAEETKILTLEEDVYKFLKNTVEHDIPSSWGASKNIVEAIELFMNAREE